MEETVFNRVIRKAQEKNWSQSDLAKHLGLLPQHVSNWKSRGVPPDRYEAIANVLDCSIDELLGRKKFFADPSSIPAQWPFRKIDESKVRALDQSQLIELETIVIVTAAQLGLDVKKDG